MHTRYNKNMRVTGAYQQGQSMVEYTVVVIFFCLTLTSEPMLNMIGTLADTLKQRQEHYTYVVSLSDYPDANAIELFRDMLREQLEEQGLDPDEINELLGEKADSPEAWADYFSGFIGERFPIPDPFDIDVRDIIGI
jgi:predicted ATPase